MRMSQRETKWKQDTRTKSQIGLADVVQNT